MKSHNFCAECGSPLAKDFMLLKTVCSKCGAPIVYDSAGIKKIPQATKRKNQWLRNLDILVG